MRRGFTILEILIAMAIFVIGVVSIMAVMPVGIRSSNISTQHSVAAALAESLDDALTLALRQYSGTAGNTAMIDKVHFFHDGCPNGTGSFILPDIEIWQDTGGTIGPAGVTYVANGRSKPAWFPMTDAEYGAWTNAVPYEASASPAMLGSLGATAKGGNLGTLTGTSGKDFPDPLSQYGYRFMVHEYKTPNDYDADEDPTSDTTYPCTTHPTGGLGFYKQFEYQNGTEAEVIDRLYQFTVYIYHGWKPTTCDLYSASNPAFACWSQAGAAGNFDWRDQMKHPNKVERFEFLIYSQGAQQ